VETVYLALQHLIALLYIVIFLMENALNAHKTVNVAQV